MDEVVSTYLEMAVSIFIYVACTAMTLSLLAFAQNPIITLGSDKTLVESAGVQQEYKAVIYGRDLLLSLLNTDVMSPPPKSIKINDTPVIKLDNSFLANKVGNVSTIYSNTGVYKLSSMLNWTVTSTEYVYTGPGAPYIHIILEE